jgi:hypothetical protein
MTGFFSVETLWQLFLYGLVSLFELIAGWGIMIALRRRGLSWWWSFFFQSIVIGFTAFVLRKYYVFVAPS